MGLLPPLPPKVGASIAFKSEPYSNSMFPDKRDVSTEIELAFYWKPVTIRQNMQGSPVVSVPLSFFDP